MNAAEILGVEDVRFIEPEFSAQSDPFFNSALARQGGDEGRLLVDEEGEPLALAFHGSDGWIAASFLYRHPAVELSMAVEWHPYPGRDEQCLERRGGCIARRPRKEALGALADSIPTERPAADSFLCPLYQIGRIRFQTHKTNAYVCCESSFRNRFRRDTDASEALFTPQNGEGGAIHSRRGF